MSNFSFPQGFLWGVAGSALQMEGAMREGGKCLNASEAAFYNPACNDMFADRRPPDVNCDFYHKYPQDLALFHELGVKVFRFSISWSRIIPAMDAQPNQAGIDYYNRVINEMLKNDLIPFFDLWHSDLPQWVKENGGPSNPDFPRWYLRYAEVCLRAFGDRVKYWSTVNEPKLTVYGPLARVIGATDEDIAKAFRATHHMLQAHFGTVKLLRQLWPDAKIGSTHNSSEVYCRSFEAKDIEAAKRGWASQWTFLDPMAIGRYPQELLDYPPMAKHITEEYQQQLTQMFAPMDFCGLNYYSPSHSRAGTRTHYGTAGFATELPHDAYPFTTYASGLQDLLLNLQERYNGMALIVTENGYTSRREDVFTMDLEPLQHDIDRELYIREHVRSCARALRAGVNLQGYFYWSAMDCWEGTRGYGYPMGLVGVNFDTLERVPRDSFYYYQKIVKNNMVD